MVQLDRRPGLRTPSEERAIPAVAPRRRLPVQARRVVPPRKPVRRFAGPIVLAGVVLGLVVFLLLPQPVPEPLPEAVSPAADVTPDATVGQVQEGVPAQAIQATLAPSEPTPDDE